MLITYEQIMCTSPSVDIKKDYSDTVVNFIQDYRHKFKYKPEILVALCDRRFLTRKELSLFALWCARQVQHLMTDKRSIDALDAVERYLNGDATNEEMEQAKIYAEVSRGYAFADHADDDYRNLSKAAHAYAAQAAYAATLGAAGDAASAAVDACAYDYASAAVGACAYDYASQCKKNTYEKAINYKIDKLLEIFEQKEREQHFKL